jgi:hypothetical protein
MKNLLKNSTIAVAILSLFVVSCKKADVDEPAPAPSISATTTWTPKGSETPIVNNGDVKNGDIGVAYRIDPIVTDVCEGGTWSLTVDAPPNAQYAAPYSAKNGYVTFTPLTAGTYKLTLTYTSPCGIVISITITITVS